MKENRISRPGVYPVSTGTMIHVQKDFISLSMIFSFLAP